MMAISFNAKMRIVTFGFIKNAILLYFPKTMPVTVRMISSVPSAEWGSGVRS
jgi:hypothetical protein